MRITDNRFQEASQYAFEKIFPALVFPVRELLTREAALMPGSVERKALLSAAAALIFTALKTITKFHSFGTDLRDDVENFVSLYFPETYRWQYKKLYRTYEQGLLHYLGHAHNAEHAVIFTGKSGVAAFEQISGNILRVNVPEFFLDFQAAVKKFTEALNHDDGSVSRDSFFRNYEKIISACAPLKTLSGAVGAGG